MSDKITVGEAIARTLEQYAVSAMYGIISIHNLPIADAVGQRGQSALCRRAARRAR
ncbi:Predicted dinucleotide-utilizing enzyme [Serratia rubidaea]|uniref:Predicted dinucleotide-utilizing enzyme n=1 Tax=Serratia rubidaea TaxID=61652 RepID=A0A4U9HQK6_SERRU|nr:Predicted dinucleotide-utilizing enzyme [Serratia rubidaea]